MKITLGWLKEHLVTDKNAEEISKALTSVGLEVEEVIDQSSSLEGFETARIAHLEKHPDADKLNICQVETKDGMVQVVCGASNVYEGLVGVLAKPGVVIPNGGFKIKESSIRGQTSCGMMCSLEELGLAEASDGIIELPLGTAVGISAVEVLSDLIDPIFDLSLTPNKAECAGVRGIARELYAKGCGDLKDISYSEFRSSGAGGMTFEIKEGAPFIAGRVIKGVRNGDSPAWLKNRLERIGIKPKSALVDITNYILFDLCRPLHVYDLDTIEGGSLSVECGFQGEFSALDGETYALQEDDVVICDSKGPVVIAGIMGGGRTACHQGTSNVFLESALFDKISVAETKRRLGLHTDSSYRFERGVDTQGVLSGLDVATAYILDICGGEAYDVVTAGKNEDVSPTFSISKSDIESITGVSVPMEQSILTLEKLGYRDLVKENDTITARAPSFRHDVDVKEVLVEDIMRMIGYEHIQTSPLPPVSSCLSQKKPALNEMQRRLLDMKRIAVSRGFLETVSYTFVSHSVFDLFDGQKEGALVVANPISADLEVMRSSLLASLVIAASSAYNKGHSFIRLCEAGPVFDVQVPFMQKRVMAGLCLGKSQRHWRLEACSYDFYDIKAEALSLLEGVGCSLAGVELKQEDLPSYYHPTRSAALYYQKKCIGFCGEMHPEVIRAMGIKGKVQSVGFELFVDNIPFKKKKKSPFIRHVLQPVTRDFAFLVDQGVSAKKIEQAIISADRHHIEKVVLFDVFEGDTLEGKKSMAFNVVLRPKDKTFTDEDIKDIGDKITSNVLKKTGAELRMGAL